MAVFAAAMCAEALLALQKLLLPVVAVGEMAAAQAAAAVITGNALNGLHATRIIPGQEYVQTKEPAAENSESLKNRNPAPTFLRKKKPKKKKRSQKKFPGGKNTGSGKKPA